jgi:hypothetical protein
MTRTLRTLAIATLIAGMTAAASPASAAFVSLPASGAQVNDDAVNSIDPKQDAGLVDVAGGTVVAGNVQVPWATFEQKIADSQQIFVRAFKKGEWVTQGSPASLNIDPTVEAEAPSIDFAGAGRTVPWVAWYEPNARFGEPTNIFASRFNAGANVWLPSGQDRADGARLPSLNIHTDRTAQNPSVAGGATVAGNDPVPWIIWEENDGGPTDADSPRQIFVSKGVKQAAAGTPCTGFKRSAANNLNGFCWQQVGLERLASAQPRSESTVDPTLNIDPTRAGVEPDIAFTGKDDTVVWTVWYEEDPTQVPGLRSNQMVFAAKAVANPNADGGFQWVAVGDGTAGQTNVLDVSGNNGWGPCAESQASEDGCSLNAIPGHDAENPRVAAGTLTQGKPTVPWVVWEEDIGKPSGHAIFVSRLVGGDHFELFNGGQPISNTANDASRPDIAFAGNVPYITWQEDVDGSFLTFVGHFEGAVFKLDTPGGIENSAFGNDATPFVGANPQRAPISSTCTANPTNADGAACQGGAIGTPFFLFTAGSPGSQKLFAEAFAPSDVQTLAASDVTSSNATLNGSANPGGTSARVHFDFGATTAYDMSTAPETLGVAVVPSAFDALLAGLPNGSTLHYRAVAASDFATVAGPDATVDIVNQPPVLSVGPFEAVVRVSRRLALSIPLSVDEPATVTIQLLNKKRRVVRETTVSQAAAGAFTATLSLRNIRPGHFTLHLVAVDANGASSAPVDIPIRVRR